MSTASPIAERAVLGAVLADANCFFRVADRLVEDYFQAEENRLIWAAYIRLAKAGVPIDLITASDALERAGTLALAGGRAYLGSLADGLPDCANVEHYAAIVAGGAAKRELANLGRWLLAETSQSQGDARVLLAETGARLGAIGNHDGSGAAEPIRPALDRELARLENLANEGFTGLPTGYGEVDHIVQGFESQDLVILASRPGVGKTALAGNLVRHLCPLGKRIAFFSLEMSTEAIVRRLIAGEARVPHWRLRLGKLDSEDWQRVAWARDRIAEWPLWILDRSGISPLDVLTRSRRLALQQGLDLVIVDYLGKLAGSGTNRTEQVGGIARGLKDTAKSLRVPVLALCQLTRANAREERAPHLSDLRESGDIEQEADTVLLLHPLAQSGNSRVIQLDVAKHRAGPTGTCKLVFLEDLLRFESYAAERSGGAS
jgi:replicative DNA helicase